MKMILKALFTCAAAFLGSSLTHQHTHCSDISAAIVNSEHTGRIIAARLPSITEAEYEFERLGPN
jgi:hypothetical protein